MSRGAAWFAGLAAQECRPDTSVQVADVDWHDQHLRLIAVVPNPGGRFPRARGGQLGIEEGWAVAARVREAIAADRGETSRGIVLVVDVPGQAFGYNEEALGLHESLAAAVDAYASARMAGHPVVALIVGKAISGAFLAHGLQAGALLALDDAAVEVHVMSQASVARVTRRTEAEVAALAKVVPSTARDVRAFSCLGALDALLSVENADTPTINDVENVRHVLLRTMARLREQPRAPSDRLSHSAAIGTRALSIRVRALLEAQWDASA